MTDPFDALREPTTPVAPDPAFAARLRERLTRAVLDQEEPMAPRTTGRAPAWPPALTPYIVVADARAALDWYTEVLGARHRGEPVVNDDGTIGHMEVDLGDAVLMFAEPSDLYPDVPVSAPNAPTTFSHSLHLDVPDVDATVTTARRRGATVEREPANHPYGRAATIIDPFGHRWLLTEPPAQATRLRQGDLARLTMVTPNADRAKDFYETVLQLPLTPGATPGAWTTEDTNPPIGIWSPENATPEVQPCFRVDDIHAATDRVRTAGGTADPITRHPYGQLAECTDDQGTHFQLWQPPD